MLKIIKLLWLAPCRNRLPALGWFLRVRLGKSRTEFLLELSHSGRTVVVPVKDIQTLVAGLGLFTAANPWERWRPSRDPQRVIDLGGNVGLASLYFAVRFPSAQVRAVEMMPENAVAIRRLAELNRLKLEVANIAVGSSEGTAVVRLHKSHTRHSLDHLQAEDAGQLGFVGKTTTVPITRLSRLVGGFGWASTDLLKVDIEGAEKLLLDDIDDWSQLVNDVLLEVHHNVDARQAEALMVSHGFIKTGQDDTDRTELWFSK